jgi:heme exporter protein C
MEAKPRLLTILDAISITLFVVATAMVFLYAPTEAVMGNVQKVFYFHVATGWVGMLSFFVAAGAGIAYLRTSAQKWDRLGVAAVEIGIAFILINVVTGSIWARPIWNAWWTWDPRLTTASKIRIDGRGSALCTPSSASSACRSHFTRRACGARSTR